MAAWASQVATYIEMLLQMSSFDSNITAIVGAGDLMRNKNKAKQKKSFARAETRTLASAEPHSLERCNAG